MEVRRERTRRRGNRAFFWAGENLDGEEETENTTELSFVIRLAEPERAIWRASKTVSFESNLLREAGSARERLERTGLAMIHRAESQKCGSRCSRPQPFWRGAG